MKRLLTITFSLLLLMSASSLATNTRVLTMGDNNTILLDEANIWQFPSRINDYPNLAIGEFADFGGSEFKDLGIHWRFNEDYPWVLGTYFHNSDVVQPMASPLFPFGGYAPQFVPFDDFTLLSNQRIDLFYGRKLGVQQLPFGGRFSLIHSSQKNDVVGQEREESFSIYDFALGLTVGGGLTDLALGATFMTWTDEETASPGADTVAFEESKPAGNYMVYGSARHFWQVSPVYTVVPHGHIFVGKNEAEYYTLNGAQDGDSLVQTDKYNWFTIELGAGLQYAPSNDAMVVLDAGFQYYKLDGDFTAGATTTEVTEKNYAIPYFRAGADLMVFRWMDVRFGATSYWDRYNIEDATALDFSQNLANNETFLGLGFHWGNLHVDTYTDPEIFLEGFNFISGGESDMNLRISALYEVM